MKKLLTLLLALALMLSLCACGGKDDSKSDDSSSSDNVTGSNSAPDTDNEPDTPDNETKSVSVMTKKIVCDGEDKVLRYFVYEYNDKGLEIKSSMYNADDTLLSYTEAEYDNNDNCIMKVTYSGNSGDIIGKEQATYDENGRIIKEILREQLDNFKASYSYEYNSDGLVTKKNGLNEDGNIFSWYTMTYEDGKLAKEFYNDLHGTENDLTYSYEYDADGNMIKKLWHMGEEIYETYTYRYDAEGNLTEETTHSRYGDVNTAKYKYEFTTIEVHA